MLVYQTTKREFMDGVAIELSAAIDYCAEVDTHPSWCGRHSMSSASIPLP